MGQLYCFSCGKALTDNEQERAGAGPVPICDSCREAGPQLDPAEVRWMVRRSDGPLQGPLAHETVIERLARDLLGPYDQVCRVNAEWQRLVEHPDFRGCFIPGTPDQVAVDTLRKQIASEKSAEAAKQRRRVLRAAGLMLVGIVLPIVTTTTGLGVLPESWVSTADGIFGGVVGEARGVIKGSGAHEGGAAQKPQKMPAEAAVARLREAYPKVDTPLELLIARGERGLWTGTAASISAARDDLERAVACAPGDPVAVADLSIAYAALLRSERGELPTVVDLADRAAVLAPGSVSALRAQAAAALVGGDVKKTAEIATACVAVQGQGAAAGKQDPGCAAMLALASKDVAALSALYERYPDAQPVGLALMAVASDRGDTSTVLRVGRVLARLHPDDAMPFAFLSSAAIASGEWKEARDAAGAAGKNAPWMLDQRARYGELLLKIDGNAAASVAVYDALFADALWKEYPEKAKNYADAAAAALEAGDPAKALIWTELALAEEKTSLAAVLTRARAMAAQGKGDQVESVLSAIDNSRLQGREGARYLVGVARLYLAAGLNKPASTALDAALDLDPNSTQAQLERARAWLVSGNPTAGVKQLLDLPLVDVSQDASRTPLVAVWYPEPRWDDLRAKLEEIAGADARLANDEPAALGVVAWATGAPDARALLKHALEVKPGSTSAQAALAWLLMDRGEPAAALPAIERVLADQPQLGMMHALRGRALSQLGRDGDAEKAFSQALISAAKNGSVYRWRAAERAHSGDKEGARADAKKALELSPDDLSARLLLSSLN